MNKLLEKAEHSSFWLWITNRILWWKIPFNSPHSIRIAALDTNSITMTLPFKRKNKNHINSMHACALATVCEYVTGMQLARCLNADQYRLILREIKMEYTWQAKMDVKVKFQFSSNDVEEQILLPLQSETSVVRTMQAEVKNIKDELVCRGFITWQVKKWENVRTKL